METTNDERIRPTAQQLQRLRRTEAKSQKALADFLDANPALKRHVERNYREPQAS